MTIETERLLLRPWEDGDAADLYALAKDPRVGPAAGWPVHTSEKNSLEIIRAVLSDPFTFAVTVKGEGRAVGSIGAFPPRGCGGSDELEIGYWLGVPYWGRGYMPEAVKRLMRLCFEDLDCRRVWCRHFAGNDKSRRVIEKCGFRREFLRESAIAPLGERKIEYIYSITAAEWRAKSGAEEAERS